MDERREHLGHDVRAVAGRPHDGPTDAATDGAGEIALELGADRILRVHLGGKWQLDDGLPSTLVVEEALRAPHPPRAVSVEAARLVSWDSSLFLALRRIDAACRGRGVPVTLERPPVCAQRLLALADAVREKPTPPATRPTWLARVGQLARQVASAIPSCPHRGLPGRRDG